jgi:DmsA/YnfE family anaerobic dimethyl sulfoxide reductase A subunit
MKIVWSSCNVNCVSRCPLRVHVEEGRIVRVETDNTGEDSPGTHEIRACLRGRAMRKWVYSPERLLYPMKRVGKRGEGKFERISWDDALDLVTQRLQGVIQTYGNEAVFRIYGTGNIGGVVSGREQIDRLMNLLGGQLGYYNSYSSAQITHGMYYTYGKHDQSNQLSDSVNSKLVVFFGNNPAETKMSGGSTIRELILARQKNPVRTIVIDPRYSDTAADFADEWIPIRPGTDAALVSGLAWVLITENLVDQEFLDRYCIGYDDKTMSNDVPRGSTYKDYILGTGTDGTAKTPQWAAAITGIPADRIVQLAREIGAVKPVYIAQGLGPQRHANGEQTSRAICMLPILTGNIGIKGGNNGEVEPPYSAYATPFPQISVGKNPVDVSIPCFLWTKAIADHENFTRVKDGLKGREKLGVPVKFLWSFASNTLINQHSDIGQTHRILTDEHLCETIVLIDNVMTASARYADILLPATSSFEESDLTYQGHRVEMGALILRQKVIEPLGESRTLYDICAGIARRMNIEPQFTEGRSHDGWIEHMYARCRGVQPALPESFQDAVRTGLFKWRREGEPRIGLKAFREDPEKWPLSTPSGRIEIFSRRLWDLARTWELPEGDVITALPEYHATWGMPSDRDSRRYPLQLIGHHHKQRTHSSYANNPWLQEVASHWLWINPMDARTRGIAHGDTVQIYNDMGRTLVRAKVTPRIMPGVLSLPQGAWYTPDENGIDRNGSINVLTNQRPSPLAKGNPQHTNLVEVRKT